MIYSKKIKKTIKQLMTLLILTLCISINAQTKSIKRSPILKRATPESVGMSSERLSRIDVMCEKAVSESNIPGIVALVVRHGKIAIGRHLVWQTIKVDGH